MATSTVNTTASHVNTPSTYRLAGSCSFRAYVACDDTPYHLEQPITRTLSNPDPNHSPERAAKVRALVLASSSAMRRNIPALVALIDANPEAEVTELVALLNQ